jgi:hypothetical protein
MDYGQEEEILTPLFENKKKKGEKREKEKEKKKGIRISTVNG